MDCSSSALDEKLDCCKWSPTMGEHRLRLRPWLESMLNSNKIKGLEWLDDKKTCFKIPWKHRSKKDWDTNHVQVFMEWAKHTGKHHEGEDPDYVAMKTRLRCAFNKAPDIEEVKHLHSLKSAEPYRVYRFIQKPDIAAWKESTAKQLPPSSRVCAVHPTVCQQNEDDSLSDTDVDSDSDDEVIMPSTKPDPDAAENCEAATENSVQETTNCNVNPSTSSSSSSSNNNNNNSVDTNDAAKLLLSLKSGLDQKTPLVIKPQEPTATLQSSSALPVELISHLLSHPKWKIACRMADGQRVEITSPANAIVGPQKSGPELAAKSLSNGACTQNVVVLNRASLNEFICKQQAKTACSNQGANVPQASANILPPVVQIKTEVVSPENDDSQSVRAMSATAGVSLPTLSVSNGAVVTAQPHLPVCRVPNVGTSSQVHLNGAAAAELPYSDSICNNTRHRKLRRPVLTSPSMKKQFPAVHKVLTRKRRNTSGVTFSNHGNIMATGVKNTIKEVASTKEPVLCEEMLRMREAYGVPVHRTVKGAQAYPEVPSAENGDQNTTSADGSPTDVISGDDKNQTDVEPDKNKPGSNADPPKLVPVSQKLSESSESTRKGAYTEMKIEEIPCEILDLRIPRTAATQVQEESAQILDLSLKHEEKKPCFLTEQGALDLTLKRKNDNGALPLSKRPNVKKGASLTMHAIWDLSNPKPKDDGTPRQCSPVAVDLTQSSTLSTKVKLENELSCEDASTKTEFSINTKASQDDSEVFDVSKAVNQVPTLVSERVASEDDYNSYEDDESREDELNDDDLDINDEDNDTKLAAKQLLELSSRCHRTGKGLPSEELIRAAVNKQVKMEMPEKGASCSSNNWGADLYRRGSPPSSGALSRDSSGTRQRLRPWLESKISSGEIKGLEWVEKEKGIFKIPWKHGGKHDWTPENSRIFMEWAKHTGRYREGIDEEDYATWKTRLRCAFNKAPDIKELKDLTDLNCSEPYRVYRLVPKKEMHRFLTPVSSLSLNSEERTNVSSERQQLPIVVEEFSDNTDVRYPSDLRSLTSDDLYQVVSHVEIIEDKTFPSDPNTGAPELSVANTSAAVLTTVGTTSISAVLAPLSDTQSEASGMLHNPGLQIGMEPLIQMESTDPEYMAPCPDTANLIKVELKYQGKVILERELDGKQGCFITSDEQQQNMQHVLVYPQFSEPKTHQETQIMSLLPFMKDGVWITCLNGTIYAKRSCKCGVFYVSAAVLNGEPVKLKRGEDKETIFDFNEHFLSTVDNWKQVGLEPDPCVHLMFGQTCKLSELNENILISLTVTSMKAQQRLATDMQANLHGVGEHFQTVKVEPTEIVTLVDQSTGNLVTTTGTYTLTTIDNTPMDT